MPSGGIDFLCSAFCFGQWRRNLLWFCCRWNNPRRLRRCLRFSDRSGVRLPEFPGFQKPGGQNNLYQNLTVDQMADGFLCQPNIVILYPDFDSILIGILRNTRKSTVLLRIWSLSI